MAFRDDIKLQEIISLYESGLSVRKISKRFGCAPSTIGHRLWKQGLNQKNSDGIKIPERRSYGITPVKKGQRGQDHPRWNGGRFKRLTGYVYIWHPEHPRSDVGGYVPEHIWVWETYHNKSVPKGYVIHHLNGIKDDNRPGNLFAVSRGDHNRLWASYQKRIRELEMEIAHLSQPMLFPKD